MRWALLALFVLAAHAHSRVLDIHSDIRIAKSGELTVTERITFEAKPDAPGLERELPPAARIVDVIRNGHPEPYVFDAGRLRTGARPLPAGRHLYQIAYRSSRHIAFVGDHDALHWSVRGGERLTAEVVLPASVPARQIKVEIVGDESQSFVRNGRAAFRAKEAMAIVVRFPKQVVAEPALGERARWFWNDYLGLLGVLLLLALNAGVLLLIRRAT